MSQRRCPFCMQALDDGDTCPSCGHQAREYVPLAGRLAPGVVLMERYPVGRVLGAGGFGITYLGFDERLACRVAIKELLPIDLASRTQGDPTAVVALPGRSEEFERLKGRFLEEAQRLAAMRGRAGIVGVYDYFEDNGTAYYVMDYLDGVTLEGLVRERGGRIAPADLLCLLEPVLDALEALHATGTIHRDISPDNIMVTADGARLIDFGNARRSMSTHFTGNYKDHYAPVEQLVGMEQDARTDIYSLCATIYFCLTGTEVPSATERQVLGALARPRDLGVELTPAQESALMRGLSVRRSRRQGSVAELRCGLCQTDAVELAPASDETGTADAPAQIDVPAEALPQGTDGQDADDVTGDAGMPPSQEARTGDDGPGQTDGTVDGPVDDKRLYRLVVPFVVALVAVSVALGGTLGRSCEREAPVVQDSGETAQQDPASEDQGYVFPSRWEGSYLGSTTSGNVSIPATRKVWFELTESDGEVTGVCSVGTDDGKDVVDGTFRVEGTYDPKTQSIALTATEWVDQGDLWGMRNFWGTVEPDMTSMGGTCIGTNSGKQGEWSAKAMG